MTRPRKLVFLDTFSELIAGLGHDRHLKGRQFERVCRWYLENDPVFQHQLRKVWLWKDWPGRWGADAGIDLVAETHAGELWAVQAKAYAPSASVTKADLDTFLSESSRPEFAMRLLVATTDHMSHNAHRTILAQEKPVRVVTASELAKAELAWPAHPDELRAKPLPKKSPRPHQRAAIKDVLKGFEESERGQLIMACGTGKTMVSLWVWEALEAPIALVVLPSLSLLAQTVREWCANARTAFDFLAVCSDESVTDSDLIVRSASELPFATTTEATEIAAFLEAEGDGRRVLFSTYQSTPRVAEALAVAGKRIDLVIADEAHRCAGRVDGGFSTVLKDEQIPSRRRLSMTATPRFLSGRVVKAAEELDVEVVSMDDEAIFGTVFHALTFGEAIAQGLLTDYQVAIIGVEGSRYQEMAEQATLVQQKDGSVTDARTLAAQAALLKGMAKYDLRRCVTFHSRVARARQFADSLDDVADSLPPDERPTGRLWADHVSGAMRSASRDSRLDRLRALDDCNRGLLANARCLAEGVDVPTLDAIAFVDPRGSQVDIVQAVGRVIRKAEEKRIGSVILPVFVADDGDAVEAVRGSAFDTVWRVLNALRAHDDVLADELDGLRTKLGHIGQPGHPSKIVLDLPASVSDDFVRAFDVRLLETTTQSWHGWYGLLEAFVEREGHALVPQHHAEASLRLGGWVSDQRKAYAVGRLDADRVAKLEALPGWSWNLHGDSWDRGFALLTQFAARKGHLRVPPRHLESGFALGHWVTTQRSAHSKGRLDAEKAERLEALDGWSWNPSDDKWQRGFAALLRYVERESDVNVPGKHVEGGYGLGQWVSDQRWAHKEGNLSPERVAALEAIPRWTWDVHADEWDRSIAALKQFAGREGHTRVPGLHTEDGFALGGWVGKQRMAHSLSNLSPERVTALEALPGWTWNVHADEWERKFAALKQFAEREGHARVPQGHKEGEVALYTWLHNRISDYRLGRLSEDRIDALESIPGWVWDSLSEQWERRFVALRGFVAREGHALVPARHFESGLALGTWVVNQRTAYSKGNLSQERVALLEALPSWTWDAASSRWERGFEALEEYVSREGHALVPASHMEAGFPLGGWLSKQRTARSKGSLEADRLARLQALPGWSWNPIAEQWERGFAALREFVAREGHALVPGLHVESGFALGGWVSHQRTARSRSTLGPERAARLEGVAGWSWNPIADQWERGFAALREFVAREGHALVPGLHVESGFALGGWVGKQRKARSRGSLDADRLARLQDLPSWSWNPSEDHWERCFAALLCYVERESDANVPGGHVEDHLALGKWVRSQRAEYARGRLRLDSAAKLESVPGWVWSLREPGVGE